MVGGNEKMNKIIIFRNKLELKIILSIIVAFSIIIPSVVVKATNQQENLQETPELETESPVIYNATWKQITDNGFGEKTNLATRGIAVYNDELYIGTHNVELPKIFQNSYPGLREVLSQLIPDKLPKLLQSNNLFKIAGRMAHLISNRYTRKALHLVVERSKGCEIWKYNYTTDNLTQIVGEKSITGMKSGFNYNYNSLAGTFTEFKNKLYVGTWSTPLGGSQDPHRKGGEIWRYDGTTWEQVVGHNAPMTEGGFGNIDNVAISYLEVFNDYLFAGTMNCDFTKKGGCEIWRTQDGVQWEQVVAHGFKPNMSEDDLRTRVTNTYLWNMEVFQNQLYAGTFNSNYKLTITAGTGCQLWRTSDGKSWEKVLLPNGDGFGEPENYGIRRMVVYNNELYVATAANVLHDKGCEIWKYDGVVWTPVISDDVPGVKPTDKNYSGFGNPLNKYVWSMTVTSDNKIWVGTANGKMVNPMEPITEGCEVWCFNGTDWMPVVKDGDNELPSGFGDKINVGARSMIEFPQGSGNIVVGTCKLESWRFLISQTGMEVWMRIK